MRNKIKNIIGEKIDHHNENDKDDYDYGNDIIFVILLLCMTNRRLKISVAGCFSGYSSLVIDLSQYNSRWRYFPKNSLSGNEDAPLSRNGCCKPILLRLFSREYALFPLALFPRIHIQIADTILTHTIDRSLELKASLSVRLPISPAHPRSIGG